jgi:hypothetical protein
VEWLSSQASHSKYDQVPKLALESPFLETGEISCDDILGEQGVLMYGREYAIMMRLSIMSARSVL